MSYPFRPFSWLLLALLAACQSAAPDAGKLLMQSDLAPPPAATKQATSFEEFGNRRVDDYFWLREKNNPEVINYLEAENTYADAAMKHTAALQDKLYDELRGRIQETDVSVPVLHNGFRYYQRTEAGRQYPIYCRQKDAPGAPEEVLIDGNREAEGKTTFLLGNYEVSPDNRYLAYASNNTGSWMEHTIRVRDLTSNSELPERIPASANLAWANDNRTIFYTVVNDALRPHRVYRHQLGQTGADALVYEEPDERFNVYVSRSKTGDFLFITSASATSSEWRYLPAGSPAGAFRVFTPRKPNVMYNVAHHRDRFFIHYKDPGSNNYKVMEAPLRGFEDQKSWKEVIAHDPAAKIETIDVFAGHLAMLVRANGLYQLRVRSLSDGQTRTVAFPEPVYALYPGATPEYGSTKLRYVYSSLNRPETTYDYDMVNDRSEKRKEQEIPSGFNPDDYQVERLWAAAPDGVQVPMAIVYRKGLARDGQNPTLLNAYGSYGSSTDADFWPHAFSLVDRGFIYAVAQIRGGSEMGEQWYEDGKLMKKKNSFTDFIACAEHLVKEQYTSPSHLSIIGGSAGGLLMGAVTNLRPDLFQAVIAHVPFVDVINTMLDETLPLTTQEYEEWGNPHEQAAYEYMLSYSPYDNIGAKNYPHMLVTAGLNDSQVLYHEPAKYVAKLRAMKTDDNLLLLKTNMDSGHGGASGRFDRLREIAFEFAFVMDRLGVKDSPGKKVKG